MCVRNRFAALALLLCFGWSGPASGRHNTVALQGLPYTDKWNLARQLCRQLRAQCLNTTAMANAITWAATKRERISLGVKQLDKDPFSTYLGANAKGTIVTGTVKEIDARGAVITLDEGVEGYIRASEISRERVEDARMALKEGDSVEAKFMGVDRKNRTITLSIKAKEVQAEAEAVSSYKSDVAAAPVGTTLGDLLKEKMSGGKK